MGKRKIEDNDLSRDTMILNGTLSFEDRRKIDKAWKRAIKLGPLEMMRKDSVQNKKSGS